MDIEEVILKKYLNLLEVTGSYVYYRLSKRVYLSFTKQRIESSTDMKVCLENISNDNTNCFIDGWKTIIVCGETNRTYKANDLVFCDGKDINVVFFLIHEERRIVFSNYSFSFPLGTGYRKYTKDFLSIISLYWGEQDAGQY